MLIASLAISFVSCTPVERAKEKELKVFHGMYGMQGMLKTIPKRAVKEL